MYTYMHIHIYIYTHILCTAQLPKCKRLGPGRFRMLVPVGVRASFRAVIHAHCSSESEMRNRACEQVLIQHYKIGYYSTTCHAIAFAVLH